MKILGLLIKGALMTAVLFTTSAGVSAVKAGASSIADTIELNAKGIYVGALQYSISSSLNPISYDGEEVCYSQLQDLFTTASSHGYFSYAAEVDGSSAGCSGPNKSLWVVVGSRGTYQSKAAVYYPSSMQSPSDASHGESRAEVCVNMSYIFLGWSSCVTHITTDGSYSVAQQNFFALR